MDFRLFIDFVDTKSEIIMVKYAFFDVVMNRRISLIVNQFYFRNFGKLDASFKLNFLVNDIAFLLNSESWLSRKVDKK